jgi:hypothetical protein
VYHRSGQRTVQHRSAYYQMSLGWLVATSAGTWVNGYTISLQFFTEGVGEVAGRYKLIDQGRSTTS